MTNEDAPRFARIMNILGAVFVEEITDAKIEAYYVILQDLPIVDLEVAAQYILRHSKWFPKPAELAQIVDDEAELVSANAFSEMKRQVGREGWTGCPTLPENTLLTIKALWGSWQQLCETLPDSGPQLLGCEKRFKETFQLIQKRREFEAIRESVDPKRLPS